MQHRANARMRNIFHQVKNSVASIERIGLRNYIYYRRTPCQLFSLALRHEHNRTHPVITSQFNVFSSKKSGVGNRDRSVSGGQYRARRLIMQHKLQQHACGSRR